jgi:hypothetical protein
MCMGVTAGAYIITLFAVSLGTVSEFAMIQLIIVRDDACICALKGSRLMIRKA